MAQEHHRTVRQDAREISELKQLRSRHPELAAAAEMQIELVELQRRIQSRVRTPIARPEVARLARGERLVDFDHIPVDWSELRLAFRQTIDILRRFDALEAADGDALHVLCRSGAAFESCARAHYARTSSPDQPQAPAGDSPSMLDTVMGLALRPFLARCAEVWLPQVDLDDWAGGSCPICGAEPDFGVLNGTGRQLVCSRCLARWPFSLTTCPFCASTAAGTITSFASRDGLYRVSGCNVCKKYVKAFDSRQAPRACMPLVDAIATLPLDAAAMQKGYDG